MSVNLSKNLKKLVDGDDGYDAGVDKYEVDNVVTQVKSAKSVCTIAEIDTNIASFQAAKAEEITRWDDRIADLEQLKLDLLGLP